jgi:hypothetical protein
MKTTDLDIVFLSYDEPNADFNFADLKSKFPQAKRVHGVKGFDAAHKACANLSNTERFITVDGDNLVHPRFFDLNLNVPENSKIVYSCNSENSINGLCYGNGGLKIWTREFVLSMKTHEAAETQEEKVDFCWSTLYSQINNVYSTTVVNSTAKQAFRAGFREGVKMFLDRGKLLPANQVSKSHYKNLNRLLVWSTVGYDVENGIWAIYGTRLALYMIYVQFLDFTKVADYDWFEELWSSVEKTKNPVEECNKIALDLKIVLGLNIPNVLNSSQSKWFKQVYEKPRIARNPLLNELEFETYFEPVCTT